MAISKVILNGDTLMDVTSDTVEAGKLLSNETATRNDGTKVTGNIASKSSTDLSVSGATVTAPAGYYSSAVSKSVAAGSAFPPAVTITKAPTIGVNTSGVVTASYNGSSSITPTVSAGYVSQGTAGTISTTGTSTYQLTSKAAATYYPSTADQTIASQRWLVGNQTIKSVTTSNLTAENIAEGVVVKVGDSANASRITQITGTHSGGKKYYATITSGSGSGYVCACYPGSSGTTYFNTNDKFEITEGSTIYLAATGKRGGGFIYINGTLVVGDQDGATYLYTVPSNTDVEISLSYESNGIVRLTEVVASLDISENGTYNVSDYDFADVNVSAEGGFTADQIAMRTISGDISGSASIIGGYAFAYCSYLTTVSFPSCTTIGSSAFYNCAALTTVSFPACSIISTNAFAYCQSLSIASFPICTTIGISAFTYCPRLTTVSFPSCTTISSSAFAYCYSLTTVSFPSCAIINGDAFHSCSSLTTVSFPVCSIISTNVFYSCRNLSTVSFPSCTKIGGYAFAYCSNLTTVNFSSCTTIDNGAFYSCPRLTTVNFPSCTTIGSSAFYSCHSLTIVSFPSCTKIGNNAFAHCYNLLSIYLLGSSIPSISAYTFISTPISNNTTATGGVYGSIFVPASLYDSYLTATNWSLFSSRIVSV